jgi:hypothetical protein
LEVVCNGLISGSTDMMDENNASGSRIQWPFASVSGLFLGSAAWPEQAATSGVDVPERLWGVWGGVIIEEAAIVPQSAQTGVC